MEDAALRELESPPALWCLRGCGLSRSCPLCPGEWPAGFGVRPTLTFPTPLCKINVWHYVSFKTFKRLEVLLKRASPFLLCPGFSDKSSLPRHLPSVLCTCCGQVVPTSGWAHLRSPPHDGRKRYTFRRNRTLALGVCPFPVLAVRAETLPWDAGQQRRERRLVSPAAARVSGRHWAVWS